MSRAAIVPPVLCLTLLTLAPAVSPAQAPAGQAPGPSFYNRSRGYQPFARPQLSPFLNLIRGGDPSANYFLGTVNQRNQRFINQQIGSNIASLDEQLQPRQREDEFDELYLRRSTTGHPTAFQYYGSYFGQATAPLGVPTNANTRPVPPPRRTRR